MNARDIAGAAAVIADAVEAAGPSDTAVLLLAFGIFRRAHFPPGRLIIKALQARLTDAQYRSLVTTWTEYCRAGLSEAEVEKLSSPRSQPIAGSWTARRAAGRPPSTTGYSRSCWRQ